MALGKGTKRAARGLTVISALRPSTSSGAAVLVDRLGAGNATLAANAIVISAAVLLLAVLAQVRIPLGFTPVPMSGQTFGVLLIGPALGSKRAVGAIVAYLALGALGLPLFTDGGAGIAHLLGPTVGYLLGFVVAAGLLGVMAERRADRHLASSALSMLIASASIYVCGVLGLMFVSSISLGAAISLGIVPFLIGDLLKAALAAAVLPSAWALVRSMDGGEA
jgi:biotin transport system substrate-specific component